MATRPAGGGSRRVAAAVASLAVGAVAVFALTRGGSDVDLESLYVLDPVEVGDAPQAVAVGDEGVWVTNGGDGSVSLVDPEALEPVGDPIRVNPIPSSIAVSDRFVWVGFGEGASSVVRIEPTSRRVIRPPIEIGRSPSSISVGNDDVFVAAIVEGIVARLDAVSGVVERKAHPGALEFPGAVTAGFDGVWVTDVVADQVVKLDRQTLEVEDRVDVGVSPTALTVGSDALWVANFGSSLTRSDPRAGNEAETRLLGGSPGSVATGDGFVWMTLPERDVVVRIDEQTTEIVGKPILVGDQPQGVAYADGFVWVANQGDDTITRIDLHPSGA